MTLWICRGCTTAYAVGMSGCPQCGSTEWYEEGQDMPKITVHGGPSNDNAVPGNPGYNPAPGEDGDQVEADVTAATEPTDVVADEPAAPERPAVNAPKGDWVAYALAVDPGLNPDNAAALTKTDLQDRYGQG